MRATFAVILVCWSLTAIAAGPTRVAAVDRSAWPEPIRSAADFDRASRAEILAFTLAFAALPWDGDADAWRKVVGIKAPDLASLRQWKRRVESVTLANFSAASRDCSAAERSCPRTPARTWPGLVAFAAEVIDKDNAAALNPWRVADRRFYDAYVYEQARLAALFPAVTSEILPLSSIELLGDGLPDKTFLLTFDDGPTGINGDTDRLIAILHKQHVNGVFFLLGERVQARVHASSIGATQALYAGMCLGSHGWVHKPHPKMPDWQSSISHSVKAIDSIAPKDRQVRFFRPPYGQRQGSMIDYLGDRHIVDMLWNIDSQDWNPKIDAQQVGDRVTTLMLLWRRGIVLFHDVHRPAQAALPAIIHGLANTGISWVDCERLAVPPVRNAVLESRAPCAR